MQLLQSIRANFFLLQGHLVNCTAFSRGSSFDLPVNFGSQGVEFSAVLTERALSPKALETQSLILRQSRKEARHLLWLQNLRANEAC